jgi:general secretion pathway protein M
MSDVQVSAAAAAARWTAAQGWWRRLGKRERLLLVLMVAVVLVAAMWFVGLAPALRTLRTAPAQIEALERQAQAMQVLAAQVQGMQGRLAPSREEALRELELSVRQRLAVSAQVNATADHVTVVLKDAPPQSMAAWLSQARLKARVVVSQANLTLTATGWEGSLVFNLPPAP